MQNQATAYDPGQSVLGGEMLNDRVMRSDGGLRRVGFSGVDASSWVSWISYLLTFWVALGINPHAGMALRAGEAPLTAFVLFLSVGAFFLIVLALQRHMRLSMLAASFGEPATLTTTGPFKWSRNPIYVAFLLPLGTIALLSPLAALTGAVLYIAAMTRWVIMKEEADLQKTFGHAYSVYRQQVPRWFAGL